MLDLCNCALLPYSHIPLSKLYQISAPNLPIFDRLELDTLGYAKAVPFILLIGTAGTLRAIMSPTSPDAQGIDLNLNVARISCSGSRQDFRKDFSSLGKHEIPGEFRYPL